MYTVCYFYIYVYVYVYIYIFYIRLYKLLIYINKDLQLYTFLYILKLQHTNTLNVILNNS